MSKVIEGQDLNVDVNKAVLVLLMDLMISWILLKKCKIEVEVPIKVIMKLL